MTSEVAERVVLEAGIETDVLMAERVMGWKHISNRENLLDTDMGYIFNGRAVTRRTHPYGTPFQPSAYIDDAMEVVDWLHRLILEDDKCLHTDVNYLTLTNTGHDWAATFGCIYEDDEWFEPGNERWPLVVHAETAALAICRAASLVIVSK